MSLVNSPGSQADADAGVVQRPLRTSTVTAKIMVIGHDTPYFAGEHFENLRQADEMPIECTIRCKEATQNYKWLGNVACQLFARKKADAFVAPGPCLFFK